MNKVTPRGPLDKPHTTRDKRLTQEAQGKPCTLRLPFICSFDDADTVSAHVPGPPKSQNSKISDFFTVHACGKCHDAIGKGNLSADTLRAIICGLYETQTRLVNAGLWGEK